MTTNQKKSEHFLLGIKDIKVLDEQPRRPYSIHATAVRLPNGKVNTRANTRPHTQSAWLVKEKIELYFEHRGQRFFVHRCKNHVNHNCIGTYIVTEELTGASVMGVDYIPCKEVAAAVTHALAVMGSVDENLSQAIHKYYYDIHPDSPRVLVDLKIYGIW